jgi:hypothetical protein
VRVPFIEQCVADTACAGSKDTWSNTDTDLGFGLDSPAQPRPAGSE